jgi:hypothetical protein
MMRSARAAGEAEAVRIAKLLASVAEEADRVGQAAPRVMVVAHAGAQDHHVPFGVEVGLELTAAVLIQLVGARVEGFEGHDGSLLLKCFAGCRTEDVLAALGLAWGDLFVDNKDRTSVRREGEVFPGLSVSKSPSRKTIVDTYDYVDEDFNTVLCQDAYGSPIDLRGKHILNTANQQSDARPPWPLGGDQGR